MRRALLLAIGIAGMLMLHGCNDDATDKPVELHMNFKPGIEYKYTKTDNEVLEPEGKKPSFLINQDKVIETNYRIDPDGNNKKISFYFNRIAIKAGNNNITTLEYDSGDTAKQKAALFGNIKDLLNKEFIATINPRGEVVHIQKEAATADTAARGNMQAFSDNSINAMVQELFNIYPDRPVHLNEDWKKRTQVAISFINVIAETNYRLISVYNDIAHIEVNANLKSNPADSMDVKMRGVQNGVIDIDVPSGMIIDAKLKSHMTGQVNLGINAATSLSSDVHIVGARVKDTTIVK